MQIETFFFFNKLMLVFPFTHRTVKFSRAPLLQHSVSQSTTTPIWGVLQRRSCSLTEASRCDYSLLRNAYVFFEYLHVTWPLQAPYSHYGHAAMFMLGPPTLFWQDKMITEFLGCHKGHLNILTVVMLLSGVYYRLACCDGALLLHPVTWKKKEMVGLKQRWTECQLSDCTVIDY